MVVFSYIFFEVLDLDGSNFANRYPVESSAIVAEIEADIDRPYLARSAEPLIEVSSYLVTRQAGRSHQRLTESPAGVAFHLLRHCGYRIALPRSSIPDPFSFYA